MAGLDDLEVKLGKLKVGGGNSDCGEKILEELTLEGVIKFIKKIKTSSNS